MRFVFGERLSDSPYVDKIWRTHSECPGTFLSRAVSQWEMVVWRSHGKLHLTVRGPETKATLAQCPANAEFVGIQFKLGTFMPQLPASGLVDGAVTLPKATPTSFWLLGTAWEFPNYENADTFADRLVRADVLVRDPVVAAAAQGQRQPWSIRSVQSRFVRATGLTYSTVRQIERAQRAAALLQHGTSILDTVHEAGYFDQPHLTRSLKRFLGQTPAHLVQEGTAA